ncbi:hypothetical protein [Amphibacillus cookii]|uniref:hypothetical protein n=1 Tax=Amphibacillus cookii TaxID=767787 RepID=UPI00195E28D9|nr:hypothetical protein [Amphibacillus cookii]MBM7543255.1 hypothetical protein [Amphibacillus cookii]
MKRKILALLVPIFFVIPLNIFADEFDFRDGIFDNYDVIDHSASENYQYVIDNDLETYSTGPYDFLKIKLTQPVNIDGFYLNSNSTNQHRYVILHFSNGAEQELILANRNRTDEYIAIEREDLIEIQISSSSGGTVRVYQFELFGEVLGDAINVEEIKNINVEAEHDRVNLSWELPDTEHFDHVNIYRMDLGQAEQETSMFEFLRPLTVNASENYQPLFETNGTYFNDLSVEENNSYEYKLTTEYQGVESEGVTVQATTGFAPAPPIGGDDYQEQPNGDYLVTWESPTDGDVRVLLDGEIYATVPASDGQFTVPATDMVYNNFGDPLIGIQPVAPNGQEGSISQPSGTELPFTPRDLIGTGNGLLMLVSGFVLLALAFVLVPKIIKVIRSSMQNESSRSDQDSIYRRSAPQKQERPQRKHRMQRESRIITRQPRQGRA